MANYLAWGTSRTASIAHAIPLPGLAEPIGFLEIDTKRYILGRPAEEARTAALGFETVALTDLGWSELHEARVPFEHAMAELVLRACKRFALDDVRVPDDFPPSMVEYLRARGVEVQIDPDEFLRRRRAKTPAEIEGLWRAQTAAEAAIDHVRQRLRSPGPSLTGQALRQEIVEVFAQHGCEPHYDFMIIAPGRESDNGMTVGGNGPIPEGVSVLVDVFPRDFRSGMWGDICRTYPVGDPSPDLVAWHGAVRDALEASKAAVAPGVSADVPARVAVEAMEEAKRSIAPDLPAGSYRFNEDIGHGIGLDLHEAPHINWWGASETLVVGDVIALEPAVYLVGSYGVRLEDVIVVTEDGFDRIGTYDFDL